MQHLNEKAERQVAVETIRRHRLWEVFLVEKLGLGWERVHDIAEQLEHIQSPELIERPDAYLGYPKADPHGDLIPDARGNFEKSPSVRLAQLPAGAQGRFTGVVDHPADFLAYLDRIGLAQGDILLVRAVENSDHTCMIEVNTRVLILSSKVSGSILVSRQ